MDTKELKVVIQNVLIYEDKNEKGTFKTRLGYFCNDKQALQETDKFKGIAELSVFTNDTKLFNNLRLEHMGQPATLRFVEKPNPRNPIRTYLVLQDIVFKDETISVL